MQSSRPSSPASRVAGGLLVLASALVLLGLELAAAWGPASILSGPGLALLGSFSWAAWLIPLWLASAAVLCLLPGLRPAAIFCLITSILPFLVLIALARFTADPLAWYQAMPSLEALGFAGVAIGLGFCVLFLVLLIARSALWLFPTRSGAGEAEDGPSTRPLRLLPPAIGAQGKAEANEAPRAKKSATTTSAGTGGEDGDGKDFDFTVPELPPLPRLHCLEDEGEGKAADGGARPPEADPNGPIPLELGKLRGAAGLSADATANAGVAVDIGATGAKGPHVIEFTSIPPGQGGTVAAGGATEPADEAAATAAKEDAARAEAARRILARKKAKAYAVPVDGLLNAYPDGQYWIIDDKTRKSAEVLQETLAEFNIKAEVTGIRKGPVITMFEILPAPGVRLSKIANLADNIALRLAASSVRIVAPIPGKHAVGIEVPNERRAIVSLREIVENEAFKGAKMEIPVVLGKDIAGEAQFIDLVQTPHLLIAGATGSGKSVCVNSIILSILFRRSPEEVRLILIDPKIVELKLYNDVPHLLTPVITEPKRAFQALQYCICEMERRYSMLDRLGVRDIKSYNRKIREKALVQERLPYIVVIIDEFADLMATTGKELESTLARLAAMSRAVGIHLVLATQRPSIDVITGLIKANIPSRIAFMVASKFDSRIIIDMVGAEKLLGRGDMLFASAWDPFPIRMQGAFVSEEEVEKSVEFVKTLGEPDYIDEEIFIDEDEEDDGPTLFDDGDGDPLFEQALEIVLQQGKASASYIQRKLKIGYNRAARLVELMEERGIVGPAQGSKPRDLVRNPEVSGRGREMHEPASRNLDRQPSLIPELETVPGEKLSTKDAAASGGGLDDGE
jgi:S-DNA-T family DNA segregation ATPase FtsK/SpoIIIE